VSSHFPYQRQVDLSIGADCDCGPLGFVEVPESLDLAAHVDSEIKGDGTEKQATLEFLLHAARVRYAI
jgi:hypothetical protein